MNEGDCFYNLGVSFGHEENWVKAISCYTKAIEINPSDYEAYGNRGVAYSLIGDMYSALKDFEKSVEIKPGGNSLASFNLANYYYEHGLSCLEHGNREEALQMFDRGKQLNPGWFNLESTKGKIANLLHPKQ